MARTPTIVGRWLGRCSKSARELTWRQVSRAVYCTL